MGLLGVPVASCGNLQKSSKSKLRTCRASKSRVHIHFFTAGSQMGGNGVLRYLTGADGKTGWERGAADPANYKCLDSVCNLVPGIT